MATKKKTAGNELSVDERYELITRNLQEVLGGDELKELLSSGKEIVLYWGTMPTGSPHIAYFYPLSKIADFLKAGVRVKILLADLHAALDGVPWEILDKRQAYYKALIPEVIKILGIDVSKLEFVEGSSFQLKPEYFKDVLKLATLTSVHDATRAASEVVKLGDNPKMGGIMYPLMQALDEEYLGADIQFGGTDQRKIFVYAREFLPKIGYKPRVELMNYILPGLIGQKMSSSIAGTKIDFLESEDEVNKKINKAVCEEGNPNNGMLPFLKYFFMVSKTDRNESFVIERPAKFGGNTSYTSYESIENDFIAKKIHPMDLKNAVAKEINKYLEGLRKNKTLKKLYSEAYEPKST